MDAVNVIQSSSSSVQLLWGIISCFLLSDYLLLTLSTTSPTSQLNYWCLSTSSVPFSLYSSISLCFSLFPLPTAFPWHTTKERVTSVHSHSLQPLNFGNHKVLRDRLLVFSDGCCSRECSPSKLYKTQASVVKNNTAACQSTLEFPHFIFVTMGKEYDLMFVWVLP